MEIKVNSKTCMNKALYCKQLHHCLFSATRLPGYDRAGVGGEFSRETSCDQGAGALHCYFVLLEKSCHSVPKRTYRKPSLAELALGVDCFCHHFIAPNETTFERSLAGLYAIFYCVIHQVPFSTLEQPSVNSWLGLRILHRGDLDQLSGQ